MKYKCGLIGIGGFGAYHGRTILNFVEEGLLELAAFTDTRLNPQDELASKLLSSGAKYYSDYRQMLYEQSDMDFVVISAPIHLHAEMSIAAFDAGLNVLLEKPPAATIQDIDSIIEAKDRNGKICGVNFQKTTCSAFRTLISKICSGDLGDISSVTSVCLGKASADRYTQKPWAGKLTCNGSYVLDGTINNPYAHVLNNSLILSGYGDALKAVPSSVQAELYHGSEIESEDTSCVRITMQNGVKVLFYATLCNTSNLPQRITVKGSKGEATWRYNGTLDINYTNGEKESYSVKEDVSLIINNIYYNFIDVLSGKTTTLYSSINDCRNFVLVVNGAFESCPEPFKVPGQYAIKYNDNGLQNTYIKNIEDIFNEAATESKLLSEIQVPWASKASEFSLKDYSIFNLYK